ncbi:MAG: putative membrane protein YeaQ/YmgE (transglycosylase-associated protein family) [Methylophagaceae bacterium]|jgi:uncharacterized membrane protein YeaQ/YmgE (transglycosylase-associated protein family)
MDIIIFLAIGAIAGWLAGNLMRGRGSGLISNVIIGIIGAFLGGFVFSLIGLSAMGLIAYIVAATAGAALLLWLIRFIKK